MMFHGPGAADEFCVEDWEINVKIESILVVSFVFFLFLLLEKIAIASAEQRNASLQFGEHVVGTTVLPDWTILVTEMVEQK
jgi:hypothetical protein